MSAERTDDLVARLARELRPVRRVESLPRELACVAAAALALVAAVVSARGLRPEGLGAAPGDLPFLAVALGLGAAGLGGVLAALALARPGREDAAWSAALAGAIALGLSGAISAVGFPAGPDAGSDSGGETACLVFAFVLALPLALLASRRASRAAVLHLAATALLVGTGAMALGTLAAHLTCRTPGAWHVVFGHSVAPLQGGLVLALPLYGLLRRLVRRPSAP